MKKEYYKLNLEGSFFPQIKNEEYELSPYVKREEECLNVIYFTKISKYVYEERLTNKRIIIYDGKVVYPNDIVINSNNLDLSNVDEIMENFNELKNKDLLVEYNKIINDFLHNSHFENRKKELGKNYCLIKK